jgi:hypothetical protein
MVTKSGWTDSHEQSVKGARCVWCFAALVAGFLGVPAIAADPCRCPAVKTSPVGSKAKLALADDILPELKVRDMPAACSLTPPELRARETSLLADLAKVTLEVRSLEDGYAFVLSPDENSFRLAGETIITEKACCPFLQFQLILTQESRDLILELRGPEGTKLMFGDLLHVSGTKGGFNDSGADKR